MTRLEVIPSPNYRGRFAIYYGGPAYGNLYADNLSEEHARRIVACVNACEGVKDQDLLSMQAAIADLARLDERERQLMRERDAALDQRDELLLAAQRAFIELEYAHEKLGNDRKLTRQDVLRDARAAIANVRGGA